MAEGEGFVIINRAISSSSDHVTLMTSCPENPETLMIVRTSGGQYLSP